MEATELRAQLCSAIHRRSLVMFEYGDLIRVVEPHRFGVNSAGHEMLSGWLRAGYSRSDPAGGWRNPNGQADLQLCHHFEKSLDGDEKLE